MRRATTLAIATIFCATAAAAQTQQVTHSTVIAPPQHSRALTPAPVQPLSTPPADGADIPPLIVLGLPVHMTAPVLPPYENGAYRNFGGQPETGGDALLAASIDGN
jgi:hypothetical protein